MSVMHDAPPPVMRAGVSSVESRRVVSNRAEIYYETYADGPAILLVPGAFDNIIQWSLNIPAFVRAGYKVIAMNLRGHFLSRCRDADTHFKYHADDIRAVLDNEGIAEVAIAASSFGGFGALRFALAEPLRVKALVLSGSTAGVDSDLNFDNNCSALRKFDPYFCAGAKPPASFAQTDRPHAFLYRQLSQLGTMDGFLSCAYQAVKSMEDRSEWLRPDGLEGYNVPTMLVGGDLDTLLPPGYQRETARLIPGAMLSEWMDAGHIPFWEDPERYNSIVSAFLKQAGYARPA